MQKTKDHTIIVRGLSKEQKDSLKRQAKGRHQSMNGFLLTTVKDITTLDIETFKKDKTKS
jgi:hypothetical protein